MKYRGRDYSLSHQQVPTIPAKNTACYRGHKYQLREPQAINQSQTLNYQMSAIILKYRKAIYGVGDLTYDLQSNLFVAQRIRADRRQTTGKQSFRAISYQLSALKKHELNK